MPLTQTGRDLLGKMIVGTAVSSELYTNTYAQTIVGDSTQTFGSSQNDVGSTAANRANSSQDGGFPTYSVTSGGAPVLTFRATFGTGAANFTWNEVLTKNTTASSTGTGTALQRFQSAMGTKTAAQSWQITLAVTVTT